MSDAQNVPVFMRHIDDMDPQFLGRFPLSEIDDLVRSVTKHGCYTGDDVYSDVSTQWLCYENTAIHAWRVGFEIIIDRQ